MKPEFFKALEIKSAIKNRKCVALRNFAKKNRAGVTIVKVSGGTQ